MKYIVTKFKHKFNHIFEEKNDKLLTIFKKKFTIKRGERQRVGGTRAQQQRAPSQSDEMVPLTTMAVTGQNRAKMRESEALKG
jgi:hypothetical protein